MMNPYANARDLPETCCIGDVDEDGAFEHGDGCTEIEE